MLNPSSQMCLKVLSPQRSQLLPQSSSVKHSLQVSEELGAQVMAMTKANNGLRSGLQAKEAQLKTVLQWLEAEQKKCRTQHIVNVSCFVLV